jgi:hypothetical protein
MSFNTDIIELDRNAFSARSSVDNIVCFVLIICLVDVHIDMMSLFHDQHLTISSFEYSLRIGVDMCLCVAINLFFPSSRYFQNFSSNYEQFQCNFHVIVSIGYSLSIGWIKYLSLWLSYSHVRRFLWKYLSNYYIFASNHAPC